MKARTPLTFPRLARGYEYVEGWGMAHGAHARVLRPRDVEAVREALALARRERTTLALRGGGNSYGDASSADRGYVLEPTRLDRILSFDAHSGAAECQGGVTIEALWKHALPRGFWPKVVSGTMYPTLGGALAMNIHGKNQYAVGTIGEHVRELDLVLPSGELVTASRGHESELFHAAIGGFGMLGVVTRVVIETKRVHSGDVEVTAKSTRDLREALEWMESRRARYDYLVAWIDAFAGGAASGRGLVHAARHLAPGEDAAPERTLAVAHQELPRAILGVSKGEVWRALRLLNHAPGMRLLNAAKWTLGMHEEAQGPYRQSHAAFAFLLDYVPNWKWAYGRTEKRGLIQVQPFVPAARAHDTFQAILAESRAAGHVPYLAVLKRHRPDPFLLTHGLDGWSLALDYKVHPDTRADLWRLADRITRLTLAAGGRFYPAKDLVIGREDARRMWPAQALERFLALKRRVDPEGLLATDLSRRILDLSA
ncbi:MAG: FAD-binding oxidoreductase [Planctomycetes bacterium]|nr:FAD-binding oxidoreductase [Planctomycetota bacterium]